jgi:thiosulfate/3-mercaptopyruvate sulfurtransferase
MLAVMRNMIFIGLLATLCLCQDASNPWTKSEVIEPAALATFVSGPKPPTVICVAFPTLYNLKHISHSSFAGPGSKPEGIDMLKKAVANLPKDTDLVIYCGCCPMVKCPNIRPAYRTLKEMGFTHFRILNVPENMHTDWYTKNYPSEDGSAASQK